MQEEKTIRTLDTSANPAPLGLAAFAMTTILLNLHNAGIFALDVTILAMGFFFGGISQLIVGVLEWKKGNTFGAVAFTSYGAFWLCLVGIFVMPKMGLGAAASKEGLASFLSLWGLFTLFLFIGTLKLNRALMVVFFTLTILFALLAIATLTGNEDLHKFAGWEGIFCGLSAFYAGMAQVLNEVYGKTVLPMGVVKK